jgi:DNA repair exonuclease SbcCD ATPase subunit
LRDAQNALAEALENGATDEEIAQLMDELREAMQEFCRSWRGRSQNNPANEMQQAMPENMLRQRDLDNMLDQIENLARSGARDQAQQMLQELQRMMNNLQAGRQQRQQQQGGPMRQQMDKLGELMRQQQQLMDETMRADSANSRASPAKAATARNRVRINPARDRIRASRVRAISRSRKCLARSAAASSSCRTHWANCSAIWKPWASTRPKASAKPVKPWETPPAICNRADRPGAW